LYRKVRAGGEGAGSGMGGGAIVGNSLHNFTIFPTHITVAAAAAAGGTLTTTLVVRFRRPLFFTLYPEDFPSVVQMYVTDLLFQTSEI
jgi:hypothetical protein